MLYAILFIMLSGAALDAADNEEHQVNPLKRLAQWITGAEDSPTAQHFGGEEPTSPASTQSLTKEPKETIPPITQQQITALARAQQGGVHPWMLYAGDSHSAIVSKRFSMRGQTPPPEGVLVKQPDNPEFWRIYTFEGTQLALTTWSPHDPTYTDFYMDAFDEFLKITLNPANIKRDQLPKTPALDQLIQTMETTLNECSQGHSTNFRAQTEVTSLQESRTVSGDLLARYKGMKQAFAKHYDATYHIATLLHKAVQHDERVCQESQKRIQKNTPPELLANIRANIDSSNRNIAQHKSMLTDILCLLRAMYPAETSGWECVNGDEEDLEQLPKVPAAVEGVQTTLNQDESTVQPDVSLKTVLDINALPLDRTLVIPEVDTHEKHYQEFLRQILGTECWVLSNAKSSGRAKWLNSMPIQEPAREESTTTPPGGPFLTPRGSTPPIVEKEALASQPES